MLFGVGEVKNKDMIRKSDIIRIWITITLRESDTSITSEDQYTPSITPRYMIVTSLIALGIILADKSKKH